MSEHRMTEQRYADLNNKNVWERKDSVDAVLEIHRSWVEIDGLKKELARLKPSGQVAEDAKTVRGGLAVAAPPRVGAAVERLVADAQNPESLRARVAEFEEAAAHDQAKHDAARSEVERLKARNDDLRLALTERTRSFEAQKTESREQARRADSAESRLAAIRKNLADTEALRAYVDDHGLDDGFARWVLEGDAPQEATPCCERDTDGDGNCDRHPKVVHRFTITAGMMGEPQTTTAHDIDPWVSP
jgi:hypothetical protein